MKKLYFLLVAVFATLSLQAQLSGTGTSEDPYLISTAADLKYLSQTSDLWGGNSFFKVMNDIDMTGKTITPIGYNNPDGTSLSPFKGEFNGNHKVISNLTVAVDDTYGLNSGVGLFGAGSGTITNVGLVNPTISATGKNRVAAFVGQPSGGAVTVTKCFVDGGSVTCNGWGGTFVGATWGTVLLTDCWSSSSILIGWGSAGLVGNLQDGNATFTNVAFYGTSNGNKPITRVTANADVVTFTGVYYNANGTLVDDQTGGVAVGLTTLDNLSNYTGFSSDVWEIDEGRGFAILKGFAGLPMDVEDDILVNTANIYTAGKTLYINGIESTETFAVYNMGGTIVDQGVVESASFSKELTLSKGIYLVKVGTVVEKVIVK